MTKVTLTPEAREYLKSKGNTVISIQYEQCGG
ncbi:MAG: hypothetical protein PWR31_1049 [Bacillota bacterium]|nr:hypothetical protein [Bacillota bacterium]